MVRPNVEDEEAEIGVETARDWRGTVGRSAAQEGVMASGAEVLRRDNGLG